MGTWTPEALKTLRPMTSRDTPNVIGSQASAAGQGRYVLPDGRTVNSHGLAAALANLSHRQAKALGLTTSGIYGPRGCTSSGSVALALSSENKLRQRLGTDGSILYSTTWKTRVTPAGRRICRLVASARRISVSEPGLLDGWRTPDTNQRGGAQHPDKRKSGGHTINLQDQVLLAHWPTVQARNFMPPHSPEYIAAKKAQGHGMANLSDVAMLASWPAPTATDANRGVLPPRPQDTGKPLTQVVGMIAFGSPAPMANGGRLNPEFSRWLMGYPKEWARLQPRWSAWESVQKMQDHCVETGQDFFEALALTLIAKSKATETR